MTELELLAIMSPVLALILYFITLFFQILQRMRKVETNVKLLLQWVACLNGNMSTEKEFKDFMKKLKEVNKENYF
jgi:hypothetical protein